MASEDLEPATGIFARHYYTFCSCAAPLYLSSGNSTKAKKLFSVAINYARSSDLYDRHLMHLLCGFAKCCRRVGDLDAAKEALESALEIAEGICGYRSEQTLEIVSQLKAVSEGIAMEQDNRQRAAVASTGSKLHEVQSNAAPSSSSSSQPMKRSSRVANFFLRGLGLRSDPQNVGPEYQAVDPVPVPQYIRRSSGFLDDWVPQEQHNSNRYNLRSRDELASQAPEVVSDEVRYIPSTGFTTGESMEDIDPGLALEIFLLNPTVFIPAVSGAAPVLQGTLRVRVKEGIDVEAIDLTLRAVQRTNWLPPDVSKPHSEQLHEELNFQSIALFHTEKSQQDAPYGNNCEYILSSKSPRSKSSTQNEPESKTSFPGGLYCYPFQFTLKTDRLPTARLGHGSLTWFLKAILTSNEPSGSRRDIEMVKEVPVIRNWTRNKEAITRCGSSFGCMTLPYKIWIKHSEFFFGDKIPIFIAFGPSISSAKLVRWKCSIIQTEEYWSADGRNTCKVPPRELVLLERVTNLSTSSDVIIFERVGPKPGPVCISGDAPLPTCGAMYQGDRYQLRAGCTLPGMRVKHHLQVSHRYTTKHRSS